MGGDGAHCDPCRDGRTRRSPSSGGELYGLLHPEAHQRRAAEVEHRRRATVNRPEAGRGERRRDRNGGGVGDGGHGPGEDLADRPPREAQVLLHEAAPPQPFEEGQLLDAEKRPARTRGARAEPDASADAPPAVSREAGGSSAELSRVRFGRASQCVVRPTESGPVRAPSGLRVPIRSIPRGALSRRPHTLRLHLAGQGLRRGKRRVTTPRWAERQAATARSDGETRHGAS